jgi:hypothetical protein
VSVVRLIVVTQSSSPPASGKIIEEMLGLVVSGTPYIKTLKTLQHVSFSIQIIFRELVFSSLKSLCLKLLKI